ncbi:eukaryotic translation initiation factor 4E transporter-like isoform X2 [Adelges cooleyi]|uniref:eukaryotic translation initiation factor 4E transporter-like isoform X2 n=1 Tax=Adelges cooleyi TaxID=133065 RepID=UPI0021803E8A|nr:eukaryotic translation initiation factor 4E transporter-like isoform X2 [Adelges cooleyi]
MDNRIFKSRKRRAGIQSSMLNKVLKTMPHCKENVPEGPLNNNSLCTLGLKKVLGITMSESENGSGSEEKVKVVRFKPEQRYTKKALLEFQNLCSSKVRPKFLDNFPELDLENSKTRKGPQRGPMTSSKPATNTKSVAFDLTPWQNQPVENGDIKVEKKSQDAKDRLKKDQDIVLSPQRRSFNSGCFVTANATGPKRSNSPLNTAAKQYVEREPIREQRRIGSGRLMSRDSWETGYRPAENGIANSYSFSKGSFRDTAEPRRKDFEFDRGDSDRYRNYDRFNNKSSGNYDKRRNDSYRSQEEPEWMTDGPTSQNDTIELRGFDDPPTDKSKKPKKSKTSARAKKNSIDSTSTDVTTAAKGTNDKLKKTKKEKDEDKKKKSTTDKSNEESDDQTKKSSDSISGNEFIQAYDAEHKTNDSAFNDFNIDDFLKPDYLSDILHVEGESDGNVAGGSRFRQWFSTRDSSRASSASTEMLNSGTTIKTTTEEDPRQLSSMLMGIVKNQSNQSESKNSTNAYDSITSSENSKLPPAIMDVIKASAPQVPDPKTAIRDLETSGKVQSLEEIESRLRMSGGQQNGYSPQHNNNQFNDEMKQKKIHNTKVHQNEFENNDGHQQNNPQNYSIMQMLNNAQGPPNYVPNQGQNPAGPCYGPSNNYRPQQPNMQVPNELVMKLMEAQQKQHENNMMAKAMAAQQQQQQQQLHTKQQAYKLPVELQHMVNYYTPTKDVLHNREAQEILLGIKRGEVMLHNLVDQWKKTNPSQARYRETLICLMKLFQHSNNSQRMVNQQDLAYQQQAALYQSQMLKRQLLDQSHKRMENTHNTPYGGEGSSMDINNSSHHQQQSQPRIGLTPTSVLRKMTSTSEPLVDKHHIPDERAATQQALQHQINTLQQQIQQQQFMQQQQQQRPVNTTIQQILSGNYPRYHHGGGVTQQSNNMNGRMNYGSGDNKNRVGRVQSPVSNQLARWFSPELLAQARAGRLPNMPAMTQNVNMLSVEDIEKFQVGGRS